MLTVIISGHDYMDVLEYDRTGPIDYCCVPSNITAIDSPEIVIPRLVRRPPKLHQTTMQIVFGTIRRVFKLQGWNFNRPPEYIRATFQLVPNWNFGPKGFSDGYKNLSYA